MRAACAQFHHVTDFAPTIYEVAGVQFPEVVNGVKQLPLERASMVHTFDHPNQPSPHKVQYLEMVGNRGIYKDGWWAGSRHLDPWQLTGLWNGKWEEHPWELYNLTEDYSQAHDLAAKYPEKLKEMQDLFDSEARRNNVYPLVPYFAGQPLPSDGRTSYLYHAGDERIPSGAAPRLAGRHHRITAEVEIPERGAEGVILAEGGRYGGFSLYIKDGRVAYEVNAYGNRAGSIVSSQPLPAGKAQIVVAFIPEASSLKQETLPGRSVGPGVARLSINGQPAGETPVANFGGYYYETFDIGSDLGTP
jgi:hypothetical protein